MDCQKQNSLCWLGDAWGPLMNSLNFQEIQKSSHQVMFDAHVRSSVIKYTFPAIWYLDQIVWTLELQLKYYTTGKIPFYNWLTSKQTILKLDASSNEIMFQFCINLNITKVDEIIAFISKKMENERNADRDLFQRNRNSMTTCVTGSLQKQKLSREKPRRYCREGIYLIFNGISDEFASLPWKLLGNKEIIRVIESCSMHM